MPAKSKDKSHSGSAKWRSGSRKVAKRPGNHRVGDPQVWQGSTYVWESDSEWRWLGPGEQGYMSPDDISDSESTVGAKHSINHLKKMEAALPKNGSEAPSMRRNIKEQIKQKAIFITGRKRLEEQQITQRNRLTALEQKFDRLQDVVRKAEQELNECEEERDSCIAELARIDAQVQRQIEDEAEDARQPSEAGAETPQRFSVLRSSPNSRSALDGKTQLLEQTLLQQQQAMQQFQIQQQQTQMAMQHMMQVLMASAPAAAGSMQNLLQCQPTGPQQVAAMSTTDTLQSGATLLSPASTVPVRSAPLFQVAPNLAACPNGLETPLLGRQEVFTIDGSLNFVGVEVAAVKCDRKKNVLAAGGLLKSREGFLLSHVARGPPTIRLRQVGPL